MSEKYISRFLDSFEIVKSSGNHLRSEIVKYHLLTTRKRIKEGLKSDAISYLSTYGLSINSKSTSKFALRDVNSISENS